MSGIALMLLIAGCGLIIAELVVPGFGLLGFVGLASVIISIIMYANTITQAIILICIAVAVVAGLFFVSTLLFVKNSKFVLKEEEKPADGYVASRVSKELVGKSGVALTALHPSGAARIDGNRLSVQTGGEYIEKDEHVTVVSVEAGIVKVKKED